MLGLSAGWILTEAAHLVGYYLKQIRFGIGLHL